MRRCCREIADVIAACFVRNTAIILRSTINGDIRQDRPFLHADIHQYSHCNRSWFLQYNNVHYGNCCYAHSVETDE